MACTMFSAAGALTCLLSLCAIHSVGQGVCLTGQIVHVYTYSMRQNGPFNGKSIPVQVLFNSRAISLQVPFLWPFKWVLTCLLMIRKFCCNNIVDHLPRAKATSKTMLSARHTEG